MPSDFDVTQTAGSVYARALLEIAIEQNRETEIAEELTGLTELWRREPMFSAWMSAVIVNRAERRDTLRRLFEARLSHPVLNLLLVMSDKHRAMILPAVCEAFEQMLEAHRGEQHVLVTSAVPLTEGQRQALVTHVNRFARIEPRLEERLDESTLGGLRVQVGDTVFDHTVLRRLRLMSGSLRNTMDRHLAGRERSFVREG
jgi:F-type H+-transporting ATPase subunit delta